jgi:hypothetical protein
MWIPLKIVKRGTVVNTPFLSKCKGAKRLQGKSKGII